MRGRTIGRDDGQGQVGLTTITFAHLRRHLGKSVLIVVGLTTAVAAFVAVLSLILALQGTMNDRLSRYGASVTVTPRTPELTLSYGGVAVATAGTGQPLRLDADVVSKIQAIRSASKLAAVIPVLLQPVTVGQNEYLAIGTDIPASAGIKPWWHVEGALPISNHQILLGLNARNQLGLDTGGTVKIGGNTYQVSGVLLETGGEEDNALIMSRDELARTSDAGGQINLVEVAATDSSQVDDIVNEIERAVPNVSVASVKKSLQFNAQANSSLSKIGMAASVLIAVVAVFVVVLTMLAAVRERQKEIGVFRAVGFKRRHIVSLLFRESLLLSAVAALFGVCIGILGAALGPRLVPGLALDFSFSFAVVLGGMALSVALAAVATVYPATLAARLDPAIALKKL